MEKLNITKSARNFFKTVGVDCINNAKGVVYLHGSMRGVAAAISKILCANQGAKVARMNSEKVKVIDEKTAIVNAIVVFEGFDSEIEDEGFIRPFTL